MKARYKEYKNLDLSAISKEILDYWNKNNIFAKSIRERENNPSFVFYEGPPSANGMPGIHHVMARTIKDLFCRYKTQKGYKVQRKAGWDTHGLPVEISVEKNLGISKEDIGVKISVEDYNKECKKDVMKYKDQWDDLTVKMGYWVDLEHPYITFDNKYIETLWYLLKALKNKGLIYKGYTIQPYSPAAGTGLSTHELNQPGCYRDVKDNTVIAQFKIVKNEKSSFLFANEKNDIFFLAWTTTPWTLPSNTALALGKNIVYCKVSTFNPYTGLPVSVILAKELVEKYFPSENATISFDEYKQGDKKIPFRVIDEYVGNNLNELRYEQLLPYAQPTTGDAFRTVIGDFVTTEDGTGIVHIAPSFGADDFKVARENGIGALTLVNKQGMFTEEMGEFAGRYVKNEYAPDFNPSQQKENVDVDIIVKLKKENKAFKTEKYEHSYPHCWRTDKPILYYPLDSWFIKTTALKERMMELNKTINWKPTATGTGRFGNWLENLQDWNLSRSRFWGTPLPIWMSEDKTEEIIIGSVEELKNEIEKAVKAGFMNENPLKDFVSGDFSQNNYSSFDLHRPYVDRIILVSPSGQKMYRESDLIDVWFDSGAMPYAQMHYPFENQDLFKSNFPADFIAEGVDQTRGWFFTLHAIATMYSDSVSYKTVVSNGLVLDKNGNKMSKRLGNAVNPFETIEKFGPDAVRWYMIVNSPPWDNLKFDIDGVAEVQRKFFGTLYNTYAFFALYANIDGFTYKEAEISTEQRPEIDRWILSELNTLIQEVDSAYENYEPTKAARQMQAFLDEHLSNWYVRLSRRRFWKGEYSTDKISAYQTLYTCLETIAKLAAPIAPFFMENLFLDLNTITNKTKQHSVHLMDFPEANSQMIDKQLEERMEIAQKISSMVLSLRKKVNIRVRQPLEKILIPITDFAVQEQILKVKHLILSEVNVKNLEFISDTEGVMTKKIKPDFKKLGPKHGKNMKSIAEAIVNFDQKNISELERNGFININIQNEIINITKEDVEIISEDIPGWLVTNMGYLTVALDITITEQLKQEGIARELINRIQNIRKEKDFNVTDKITLKLEKNQEIDLSIENNYHYICNETLATNLELVDVINATDKIEIELIEDLKTNILISKV